MALEFQYINNNVYTRDSDGGSEPLRQSLALGSTVQDAKISDSVTVAENTPDYAYAKYQSSNHDYYGLTVYQDEYIYGVESGNAALNLPKHLTGWQYYNGSSYVSFPWSNSMVVNETFINTYLNGSTNLNLYGSWAETRFIRVAVSTFDATERPASEIYEVTLTESTSSYTQGTYPLSAAFKTTVDYSNVSGHVKLKQDMSNNEYYDIGTGDGCPKTIDIDNVKRATYYGVKNGSTVSLSLAITNSNYIPKYLVNTSTGAVTYSAYPCNNGLSRVWNTKSTPITLSISGNTWSASIGTISGSDKTIFIPLMLKPLVTATVCDSGTGHVKITTATSPTPTIDQTTQSEFIMPGAACYLWAEAETGYSFNGWYTDSAATTPADGSYQNTRYDITYASEAVTLFAKFVPQAYTITYHKSIPS